MNLKSIICRRTCSRPSPHLSGGDQVRAVLQIMAIIYRYFEGAGSGFSLAVTWRWPSARSTFSARYLRPIRHLHGVMGHLLCLSTIYCRYHYVVDVLAGLLDGGPCPSTLGNALYSKFGRSIGGHRAKEKRTSHQARKLKQ